VAVLDLALWMIRRVAAAAMVADLGVEGLPVKAAVALVVAAVVLVVAAAELLMAVAAVIRVAVAETATVATATGVESLPA
jgi:hypothetical protein